MTVLKAYSGGQWLPVATGTVGTQGPQGIPGRYTISATAPVSPTTGDAWYDSESGKTFVWYGSQWVEVGAGQSIGAQATVSIGVVEVLQPGVQPYVTNVGTSSAAILNFGIPQGDPGTSVYYASIYG